MQSLLFSHICQLYNYIIMKKKLMIVVSVIMSLPGPVLKMHNCGVIYSAIWNVTTHLGIELCISSGQLLHSLIQRLAILLEFFHSFLLANTSAVLQIAPSPVSSTSFSLSLWKHCHINHECVNVQLKGCIWSEIPIQFSRTLLFGIGCEFAHYRVQWQALVKVVKSLPGP
jgi:hypothetical protein